MSLFLVFMSACSSLRACAVDYYPTTYTVPSAQAQSADAQLTKIVDGFAQPTDIAFPHHHPKLMVVLEKEGKAWILRRTENAYNDKKLLFQVPVRVQSEQGLLGIAFHPSYHQNGLFYIHSSPKSGSKRGEISEWKIMNPNSPIWKVSKQRVVLTIEQPYGNHDGGQLVFGPDGMLYIGMGDGGWRDDPHNHGQNTKTLLGAILRINPVATNGYIIPKDNPFVGKSGVRAEIWAYGVRNPWRFTFAPDGRMIVADVGQDKYEEISFAEAGDNLGWKIREGKHCFPTGATCSRGRLVDPVFEYDHQQGQSVTGGYVALGGKHKGKYLFGDFVSGKMWAMEVAKTKTPKVEVLGQFSLLPSTFGRDFEGLVYVADFNKGSIYRID